MPPPRRAARPLAALDANSPAAAETVGEAATSKAMPVPPSPFFSSASTATASAAPALPGLLPRPPPAVRTFARNVPAQDPPRAASLGLATPSPAGEQARPAGGAAAGRGPSCLGGAALPPPPSSGTRWAAAAAPAPSPAPAQRQGKGPALAPAPRVGGAVRAAVAAAAAVSRPAASPAYWARLFRELESEELAEEAPTPPGGRARTVAPPSRWEDGPAEEPSAAASAPTVGGGGGEPSPAAAAAAAAPSPAAAAEEEASVAAAAVLAPVASPTPAVSGPADQELAGAVDGRVTRRAAAAAAAAVAAAPPGAPAVAEPSPPAPSPPAGGDSSSAASPPLPGGLDPALAEAATLAAMPSTAGAAAPSPSPPPPPAAAGALPASPELEGSATPAVPALAAEPVAAVPAPPAIETVIVRDEDWPATPSDVVFVGGAGGVGGGPASPTASPPSTLFARPGAGGAGDGAGGGRVGAATTGLPRAGAFGLSRRMTTTAARPSLLPGGGGGGGVRPSLAFGAGGRASLVRVPQPSFGPPPVPLGPMGAALVAAEAAEAAGAGRPSAAAAGLPPRPPSLAPARPPSAARAPPPRALPTPGTRVPRPVTTPHAAAAPSSPVGDLMARLHLTPSPGASAGSSGGGRTARRRPPSPMAGPAIKPEPTDWSPAPAASSAAVAPASPLPPGEAMARLLTLAGQDPDAAADPAALLPSMDELLELHVGGKVAAGLRPGAVVKVGEGTYGEAFRLGGTVVKVVPIDGRAGSPPSDGGDDAQKTAGELLAEAEISLALTALRDPLAGPAAPPEVQGAADASAGFGATTAVGVCWGAYSGALVRAWRAWKAAHGSYNPDPGTAFAGGKRQAFVLLFGSDGGEDLERWSPASAGEVRSVLLQATLALAVGEAALQFEHRDLHWGNVLVARAPAGSGPPAARLAGADVSLPGAAGLVVTLIDFTLSRLAGAGGGVAYCDLGADPALFAGPRGDTQAETYRRMRRAVRGDWAAHAPATNALWLHYLADVFCTRKAPPPGAGPDDGRALRGFRRRALAAPSAGALLHDEYFAGAWVAKAPSRAG